MELAEAAWGKAGDRVIGVGRAAPPEVEIRVVGALGEHLRCADDLPAGVGQGVAADGNRDAVTILVVQV